MRLLVTGGSGFTGKHVVRQAVRAGHEVFAMARSESAAKALADLGAIPVAGDLDDPESLDEAFQIDVDVLVSIASLGFGHGPTIVSAAEEAGIKRAVFISTTAITTRLAAPSKRVRVRAEETIRQSALDWTILRPTMIYGEDGDRNLSRLLRLLSRTPLLPLPGDGQRLQQPVHVEDLAHAILAAATNNVAIGRIYDIAGPEAITFRSLVAESSAAVGRMPVIIPLPLAPTISLLRAYERLVRRPRLKAEQLERLAEDKAFSIADAQRDLGYAPRSFQEGICAEAADLFG